MPFPPRPREWLTAGPPMLSDVPSAVVVHAVVQDGNPALMVVAPRTMSKLGRPTVAPDIVARRFKAYLAEAATDSAVEHPAASNAL